MIFLEEAGMSVIVGVYFKIMSEYLSIGSGSKLWTRLNIYFAP